MEAKHLYIDMCVEKSYKNLVLQYELGHREESPTHEDITKIRSYFTGVVNTLEEFMARKEMSLYTDIVLLPVNTVKRIMSMSYEKVHYKKFRDTIMMGHPFTSYDDRAGHVQIKIDFTTNGITKIN